MMTPLEARIKFKMETGYYPSIDESFLGKLKSIYGLWIEEQFRIPLNTLRQKFYEVEKVNAVWPPYTREWRTDFLNQNYIKWLENLYINEPVESNI